MYTLTLKRKIKMLNKIVYEKLFGMFDYEINLKEGGVTIITGPNGFGKSTILKSIDAFYSFDIIFFSELDFKKISFFSNNSNNPIIIKKKEGEISINKTKINIEGLKEIVLKEFRFSPYYRAIDADTFLNRRTDEVLGKNEIIRTLLKSSNIDLIASSKFKNDELIQIRKEMENFSGKTKLIREQRLLKEVSLGRFEKKTIDVIEELPDRFKEKMNQVSSKYSSEANKLDSSYPSRLFKTSEGILEEEYSSRLKLMEEKFEKLKKYDISDIQGPGESFEFQAEHSKALKIYFDDFEKKYNVFEDFINQLDLFTQIINSRLKFKEVRISREDGIAVYKANTNEKLSLGHLSSGEKQQMILFYELILESEKNIHLLIDEPELSLHIEWQLKFMDDLLKIAKYKEFKVTVATHSPQIISNHWDIQIDLGELYGN